MIIKILKLLIISINKKLIINYKNRSNLNYVESSNYQNYFCFELEYSFEFQSTIYKNTKLDKILFGLRIVQYIQVCPNYVTDQLI